MSYSDEESEHDAAEGAGGEDDRLKEYWSKKTRRRSSVFKAPVGDRLGVQENSKMQMLLAKNGERQIHFADSVIKVNRRGRTQERWLVITDGAMYNVDPGSMKVRRRIMLANIGHLSTSLLQDNFFVVHVPSEYDYLFVSSRKTEVVSVLTKAYSEATGEQLSITMQNTIDYRIDRDQQRRIVFQLDQGGVFTKIYAKKTR